MISSKITLLIENNLFDLIKYYGASPYCHLYDHKDLLYISSDVPSAEYNIISRSNIVESLDSEIIETLQVYKDRKVPVKWLITLSTKPTNLNIYLKNNGFNFSCSFSGMSIFLPHNVKIKLDSLKTYLVNDKKTLFQWIKLMENIFYYPNNRIKNQIEISLGVGKHNAYQRYIGSYNGKIIGTYTLFINSDTIGIYHVGVCKEFRNKGFGTALIQKALSDSSMLGYKISVLISVPKAKNMYQRIGFNESCKIDCYTWEKRV